MGFEKVEEFQDYWVRKQVWGKHFPPFFHLLIFHVLTSICFSRSKTWCLISVVAIWRAPEPMFMFSRWKTGTSSRGSATIRVWLRVFDSARTQSRLSPALWTALSNSFLFNSTQLFSLLFFLSSLFWARVFNKNNSKLLII